VFTSNGPGDGGRIVKLETGRPDLPQIEAIAKDGRLYLRRPTDTRIGRAFDDLVTDHDLTADRFSRIMRDAEEGAETIRLDTPDFQQSAAAHIGEQIARGDIDDALGVLAKAARDGKLDEAAQGLREQVAAKSVGRYSTGNSSETAKLFAHVDEATATSDELLMKAIGQIDDRNPQAAIRSIEKLVDRGAPSADELAALANRIDSRGQGEIFDYLRAGQDARSLGLRLEVHGARVQTVFPLDKVTSSRPLLLSERRLLAQKIRAGDAHVYLEDGLLGKVDFDPQFGRSIANMASDPGLVWQQIVIPVKAQPLQLVQSTTRYSRVTTRSFLETPRVAYIVSRCPPDRQTSDGCRAA